MHPAHFEHLFPSSISASVLSKSSKMHPMSARQGGAEVGAALFSDLKAGAQMLSDPGTQTRAPTRCSATLDCLLPAQWVSRVPRTPQTPTSFHGPGPERSQAMGPFASTHPGACLEAREVLQPCHVQHPSLSPAAPWQPPTLQPPRRTPSSSPSCDTPHHPLLPNSMGTDLPSAPPRHRDARASRPWPGRAGSFSLELHRLLL